MDTVRLGSYTDMGTPNNIYLVNGICIYKMSMTSY